MSFQYLLDNLRFLQSDVHLAVSSSKELESMLRQLGAEGRGLHQQTTSLEHTLPNHVQRRLRRVAAQRNRIVHDVDTIELNNRNLFLNDVDTCRSYLQNRIRQQEGGDANGCLIM
ncbi:MAG: hypothetical protein MHM6MM_004076 [Cercozoa sp. M6MM]